MKFYSPGKLLITGEYAVLDGAEALALPTKFGQSLEIETNKEELIQWQSLDKNGKVWLKAVFEKIEDRLVMKEGDDSPEAKKLVKILNTASQLNPKILKKEHGFRIISKLEFDRAWGLGSSSTLINNIAAWFEIDPYQLLQKTFGGSGYDIAVAKHRSPVIYQLAGGMPSALRSHFDPPFKENIYFVHLNQKQNSRQAIAHYRQQPNLSELIEKVSSLTQSILSCKSLQKFEMLIEIHETLISQAVNLPKVKSKLFKDYQGKIKSLGGWGGDFIMVTGKKEDMDYFRKKGYTTILSYNEMIA